MKFILALFICAYSGLLTLQAQTNTSGAWTSEMDKQDMMRQLGIKALRPGPSADEKAPVHANYDEAKANPYPNYPEILTLKNGRKVTTAEQWYKFRRPEIIEDFEREVYGRVPKNVPQVSWKVKVLDRERVGFIPVIAKQIIGHVDNSAFPAMDVNIKMTLVIPANTQKPVPLLMMFAPSALPAPAQPSPDDLEKINDALKAMLIKSNPELKQIFDKYPAYNPIAPQNYNLNPFAPRPAGDPPSAEQLIAKGWGYVLIDPSSIQADNGAGLTKGIIGLVNKGQPRKPEDWGALRAWAWGAGQALTYLDANEPQVDAKKVGIEGVSRYGKAALITLAFDTRFAMGLIGSSGEAGAKPHRRNFGESVENITGGAHYWMAGNFLKYAASDATFGAKTAGDIPVDAHQLIALCAPRLTFISYGIPEKATPNGWISRGVTWLQ